MRRALLAGGLAVLASLAPAHTSYSFDSYLFENRNDPRAAYAFAQGAQVGLPPLDANGAPTRSLQLERPLDFAAVTDHAELIGETSICTTPSHPQYESQACQLYREAAPSVFGLLAAPLASTEPERLPFCGTGGLICLAQAVAVWGDHQAAAQASNQPCYFTSFIGYEWTGSPGGSTLHRNVLFRNASVPSLPLSYIEAPEPAQLWVGLQTQCSRVSGGCDAIAIPHNTNLSDGLAFDPPGSVTADEAALRARAEPLVEIVQHKGESECRPGVDSTDELCAFEKTAAIAPPADAPLSYVRGALRAGLAIEAEVGVNPYTLGFVGATDTHNGTPGAVRESGYAGHGGDREASAQQRLAAGPLRNNPGGLTVLWAEENTRAALFEAMRRREAYATSGTRPIVRFFGGFDYPDDLCAAADFAPRGYADGVPMGGEIGPSTGPAPRFAVAAVQDPGTTSTPGTPLQRIQIIKGWLDADGATHERVYDVAGDAANGAGLDLETCETRGSDFAALCAVWEDPDFDPDQRAFYYARVLENPSCRWSTYECNASGVDCAAGAPPGFEACCDASVPRTIQERAYTSPIWYRAPAPQPVPLLPY
jgi:hypothetical protein